MTITLSEQAYDELWQAQELIAQPDPLDPLDVIYHYPTVLGQGWCRWIQLRAGLEVEIFNARLRDRVISRCADRPGGLCYHFHLFGQHQDRHTTVGDREFALYGSGLATHQQFDGPAQQALEVSIHMHPTVLGGFVGDLTGELPADLQQLVRPVDQEHYTRVGVVTPLMEHVLWQIVRCPYRGLSKRMYLEGKALELVSLVLEQEQEVQRGSPPATPPLTPDILERIHQARTVLLQQMANPPSLAKLAQQVQLNEYTLKRGFRQVFGKPVFEYLHDYRLEQARQLLEAGGLSVTAVVKQVGLSDRSYFAAAFRKKFGYNPSALKRKRC
jgi:AraC-like DNA-binding protein